MVGRLQGTTSTGSGNGGACGSTSPENPAELGQLRVLIGRGFECLYFRVFPRRGFAKNHLAFELLGKGEADRARAVVAILSGLPRPSLPLGAAEETGRVLLRIPAFFVCGVFQAFESRVGDPRAVESKNLQLLQALEVFQSLIGDLGAGQTQIGQLCEFGEPWQRCIADGSASMEPRGRSSAGSTSSHPPSSGLSKSVPAGTSPSPRGSS